MGRLLEREGEYVQQGPVPFFPFFLTLCLCFSILLLHLRNHFWGESRSARAHIHLLCREGGRLVQPLRPRARGEGRGTSVPADSLAPQIV